MMRTPYIEWRGRASPIVKVRLRNGTESILTMAYLDTGATYSIFNADFCDRLKLTLLDGVRMDITVGDGGSIPVYVHDLRVEIGNIDIPSKIGFSKKLGTGINIVGRIELMDRFHICFDGPRKNVIWKRSDP